MDFFGQQDSAKRDSFLLALAFMAAMLFNAFVIQYFVAGVSYLLRFITEDQWKPYVSVGFTLLLWGIVLHGCWRRMSEVTSGGHQLALSFGAERVSRTSSEHKDKTLLAVVEEMAIAASIQSPATFCLREESSINAFVAGTRKQTVLVVTQGAIDKLDRAELMAVVGHEFGHITNNDLTINMRMLIVLAGLNSIDEVGQSICENSFKVSKRRSESIFDVGVKKSQYSGGGVLQYIIGLILRALGSSCVFTGTLIKSAFSRKREYLADAKSVQYTRNSWALASTLAKISTDATKPALRSRFAGELAHMCFQAPWRHFLFAGYSVKARQKKRASETENVSASQNNRSMVPADSVAHSELKSIRELGKELSIVLSLMIESSGHNKEKLAADYSTILRGYTQEIYPMRSVDEPGIDAELTQALSALQKLPSIQRQALIDHCAEIITLDGISMEEEKLLLETIISWLNQPARAA